MQISESVAAARQGSRVEVAALRTPTRTVHANPDGTVTAELTVVPTSVKRGNSWLALDTTMAQRGDGMVGPKATIGDLSLSGGGTNAPLARLTDGGRSFALHWPGPLPVPRLEGEVATYPEVMPDVDLTMRATDRGYRQQLVIKSAAAARKLALIPFQVRTVGLKLTVEESGVVKAVDATGATVFAAPPSTMWDSGAKAASVGVQVRGGSLVLRPDPGLLNDPAAVFPIIVDPDMMTWDKNNWANILSGRADTSYWWRSAAPENVAQVGQCYNEEGECKSPTIGAGRAFFQYDTSFLSGRRVISSELKSAVVHSPNCTAFEHEVWLTNGQIDPSTTWNRAPAGTTRWGYSARGVNAKWGCGGQQAAGAGVINAGGLTTYMFKAADEGQQLAWRKLDPAQTRLSVTYNTGPNQPTGLSTDPPLRTPCRWCEGIPYIADQSIRLRATLSDPDGDQVKPKWIVYSNEVPEERWGALQNSTATHDTNLDLTSRKNNWVRWQVQAWDTYDGRDLDASTWAFGPSGFFVDQDPPSARPKVNAELYRDDGRWHGGVGVPDTFTFNANGVGDIDHYLWGWDSPVNKVDAATRLSDDASVELSPPGDGPRTLYVQSVDRAGNRSLTQEYRFYVRAENGPLAHWALDGNAKDTAFLGDRHGTVAGPVTWGPGAVDTALQIAQDASTTAPTVVRTDVAFSVQAWVKLDDGTAPRVAVSQVDSRVAGFELGYRPENGGKWVFAMPRTNTDNPVVDTAASAERAQLNTWTHLAGVHDAKAGQQRLYVNGVLAGTASHTSKWHAASDSRIGATRWNGSRNHYWRGGIDEVQIFDRPVAETEIRAAVGRDNVAAHWWKFDDERTVNGQPNTTARNSVDGGKTGTLTNGAAFNGQGAVQFDGTDDHVLTAGPAVRTDQSFSVSAWVKADRFVTGTHMTAVAQLGGYNNGFTLGYNSGHGKWLFLMTSADSEPFTYGGAVSAQAPAVGQATHLAGVYDAATREVRIYVNGQFGGSTPWTSTWNASGPLTIGRAQWRGGPSEHWPGTVDDVRLYSRALSEAEVRTTVIQANVTTGLWKLDGNANDASGRDLHGTPSGGVTWTAGQSATADSADLAARLNGSSYVSTPSAVDPTKSFSVAAWAKLEQLRTGAAVVSQDAGRISVFNLHNAWDGRWVFAMRSCDASWNCTETRAVGTEAQAGVWVHLAGTYDAVSGQLAIFVNGVLAGTRQYTHTWNQPPGQLLIGRATWGNTEPVDFFPGSIDDVTVYNRPLFSDEIRVLAGRDANLIHNWRLDEANGPAADAVGARSATPAGGATYGSGRVGNAIWLNGTDGVVSTSGVDLRTDQSFTVAAWVYLNGRDCDLAGSPRCVVDAVTVDGNQTSRFRLGHVVDNDQAPRGKWVFEMPEQDVNPAPVTEAALSVEPGEVAQWVHLVGVYDAATKKIWLYVNGDRVDDGTVNTPWPASGPLRIGRGKAGANAVNFWPGAVDDVRLYTGAQNKDRISGLYRSYPRTGN